MPSHWRPHDFTHKEILLPFPPLSRKQDPPQTKELFFFNHFPFGEPPCHYPVLCVAYLVGRSYSSNMHIHTEEEKTQEIMNNEWWKVHLSPSNWFPSKLSAVRLWPNLHLILKYVCFNSMLAGDACYMLWLNFDQVHQVAVELPSSFITSVNDIFALKLLFAAY